MATTSEPKEIVVIGGGIIGCTTAYYLTRHPSYSPRTHRITLLEASKIAGGASGKAGGLLALWAYPSNIVPLSYRLHAELAKEHGGETRWGYRRIHCGQLEAKGRPLTSNKAKDGKGHGTTNGTDATKSANPNTHTSSALADGEVPGARVSLQKRSPHALKQLKDAGFPDDLDWIAEDSALGYDSMGDPSTTAQVHPYQFTTSMCALAEEAGVSVQTDARVTSINQKSGSVESVSYTQNGEEKTLSADRVILAAGPWTQRLHPAAPISGLRAHSVTIKAPVSPYALFTSISLPKNFRPPEHPASGKRERHVAPEIYARPFGEVYACGEGDTLVPLPDSTEDVVTDLDRCRDIEEYVGSISDELREGEVTARQACYLPVTNGSGGPYIGEVEGVKGLVIASGHSCWGIQNGPGTGKLVSEIVMDGKAKSARLGQLDPKVGMR